MAFPCRFNTHSHKILHYKLTKLSFFASHPKNILFKIHQTTWAFML
jgi:hypothetical protein